MSYVPLATITLASSDGQIVFSSIPATYKDLFLTIKAKNNTAGPDSVAIRFNSDSGNNYSNVRMVGDGSSPSSYADTTSVLYVGVSTNSSNTFVINTQVMDYSATDKHKTVLSRCSQDNGWVTAHAGRWGNTGAVTSISVMPPGGSSWTFSAGSTFSLFGVS